MCQSGTKTPGKPSSQKGASNASASGTQSCSSVVCKYKILGPENVPGLSKYKYKIKTPAGKTPTNIKWSADKASASFEGSTSKIEATVKFKNTTADWIKLKATFNLAGKCECAEVQVALVKVDVEAATFTKPGKPSGSSGSFLAFLVNPPAPPAKPKWVTTHDPGKDCAKFTYNGTLQAVEPIKLVRSNGGGGGDAYKAETKVKLTSPAQKPTAHQKIQVGYIQHGGPSGSASYATTPTVRKRTLTTPTSIGLDWLESPCNPGGTDEWPWYDKSCRDTGSGSGTWTKTLKLEDSPLFGWPAQYNPNKATDPNATKAISIAKGTDAFTIRVAARTLDTALKADKHYFEEAKSTWTVNYVWPVVLGVSIVTTGGAWTKPASPNELSVNIVPCVTNGNPPFLRCIH